MNRSWILRAPFVCLVALVLATSAPVADSVPQSLPFEQTWNDTTLIAADDSWVGIAGITGYRGDGMAATAQNPETVTAVAGATVPVDVNANQTNPGGFPLATSVGFTTGGVAEFEGTNVGSDGVVALSGSGTARAPHLVLAINTAGMSNVTVGYELRDLDASNDNAISPVALQYRVPGVHPTFVNVPAAFVADATRGPALAGLITPVSATLPADAANRAEVHVRIITTDASGSDEWIGIDDITVTGSVIPLPTDPAGTGSASPSTVAPGTTTLLTVTVTPGQNPASTGLSVTADLTGIGGASAEALYDDATHGDRTAGDQVFSLAATVAPGTSDGSRAVVATVADTQGRRSTTTISLVVFTPITSVTISQVYGGGGNAGAEYRNDFVELFNRSGAAVPVDGWSVQYSSAGGTSWSNITPLSGTIQPGTYYLVRLGAGAGGTLDVPEADATGTTNMSGTDGKVALVAATEPLTGACPGGASLVDLVGYGTVNCAEGNAAAPRLSSATAAFRRDGGATDTNNNGADFLTGAPAPKNSTGQPPVGSGAANPPLVDSGDTSLLTVRVTNGAYPASTTLSVTGDLTAIGGPAAQRFSDAGTGGDAVAGDLTFSHLATVTGTEGSKRITATVNDEHGRSTQTTFTVVIAPPPLPIHVIQGRGSSSTREGQLISTSGIVTALRSSSFYIQTPDDAVDQDAETSEGLLVFTGTPRPANIAVGDLVKVTGTVTEFRPSQDPQSPPITEITTPIVNKVSSGHTLPAPVVLLPSFTQSTGNFEQLERFEGMRVRADLTAITGTAAFSRTAAEEEAGISASNGDFYAVVAGVTRPMREPGLEPGQVDHSGACCVPRFDGNPERLRVDSDGQVGAAKIDIVAGQTIAGLTGVLDYGFRSYTIVPDVQAWTPAGRGHALPVPAPAPDEFTVGSFNMERFYDTVDDPLVNDVVLTTEGYERRLAKASLAIRHVLRAPDVLGVQEVDDLSTLRAIAARVNDDAVAAGEPNPGYTAHLFEGNDIGGIDVGFLVKRARVDVIAVRQVGKDALYQPPSGAAATMNDRPPVVLEAAIRQDGATPYRITVIVNHLRSLNDVEAADGRVRAKRRAQAEFLANFIQGRQTADPAERIISVGDYNAFQFNDGFVDIIGTVKGQPTPADRVAAPSADLVTPDLTNLGDALGADQYSYVFGGNAQTLDHILVNEAARRRVSRMAYARSNADFPESLRSDATRPERLSDHDMPVAYFTLPGAPLVTLNGTPTLTVEAMATYVEAGASATDDELGSLPVTVTGDVNTSVPGTYTVSYTATNGFRSTTVTRTVNVADTTAPVLTLTGGPLLTVEAGGTWSDPGATASDTRVGDLTAGIQVTGTVDTRAVGSYAVTYTVTDGFNTATSTRTVNVVDTTAPLLGAVTASPGTIVVPNHKMVDVRLTYSATDLTGTPACSVFVTSNEAINGPGDGHTVVDWQVLDPTHVRVRAERSALGSGRVYEIAVTCTDASGNQATGSARVTVR